MDNPENHQDNSHFYFCILEKKINTSLLFKDYIQCNLFTGICRGTTTMDFYKNDCGFYPAVCKDVCKTNGCTGHGTCKDDNMFCSCTGCNCFRENDCGFIMGDRCGATCRANGCHGSTKRCVGNSMCCCDGCGTGNV